MSVKKERIGLNLLGVLDGALGRVVQKGIDLNVYQNRVRLILALEERILELDWVSLSDGTMLEKTFVPAGRSQKKNCYNCGTLVVPDGDFCPVCGDVFLKYVV
jgi:hypothetical protein